MVASRRKTSDPPRRPVLFVNPKSGGGMASRAGVANRARERGIDVVEFGPGQDLTALVDEAVAGGADALGVAGGDGSLASVAVAAEARKLPFICVPAGTRNHFARDLGLDPDDPAGALDAFTAGIETRIDVANVNGRPFLNCVSLGIYGEAVRESAYRDSKLHTLVETARAVLGPSGEVPELDLVATHNEVTSLCELYTAAHDRPPSRQLCQQRATIPRAAPRAARPSPTSRRSVGRSSKEV